MTPTHEDLLDLLDTRLFVLESLVAEARQACEDRHELRVLGTLAGFRADTETILAILTTLAAVRR